MDTVFTKSDLHRLMASAHGPDVAQAEGRFLSALRARDAILALGRLIAEPLAGWTARRQATAELNALTDRDLADIGLTRGEIEHVASGAVMRAATTPSGQVQAKRLRVHAPHNAMAI